MGRECFLPDVSDRCKTLDGWILFFTFLLESLESLMTRNCLTIVFAIAVVAIYAMTASAGNLGLVDNGDIELESRFAPHGTPNGGDPNAPGDSVTGFADAWHHSATDDGMWSDPNTDPFVSFNHSLWLADSLVGSEAEARSFAGNSTCCGGGGTRTGNLPDVGVPGRILTVSWEWDYTITSDPNHVFTATIRTSEFVGTGLDLNTDPNFGFTETFVFTGTGSSGGFVPGSATVALADDAAQWDIIFNTGDRTAPDFGGRLNATGVMFVDDVSAAIPEPTSLLLLSISGLMMMGRRRRE